MNGTLGRDKIWNEQIWGDIDNAVRDEVGRIRVAQKVFPCTILTTGQPVPAEEVKVVLEALSIEEGITKPLVEISVEFSLTHSQVDSEERLHTGRTLARMAAKTLAVKEDSLLFLGDEKSKNHLAKIASNQMASNRSIKLMNAQFLKTGFLGEAAHTVEVEGWLGHPEKIFGSVAEGISKLMSESEPGPYALFLPLERYAETFLPLQSSLVTTADRLIPLVARGFYGTGSLPGSEALLASLGGEPTTIYIGTDAITAFTQTYPDGSYRFRVFERIQYVARRKGTFVKLEFVGHKEKGQQNTENQKNR
jgi:uncharacterized linocin/CFP29 family protein